jgi:hypothetical protein
LLGLPQGQGQLNRQALAEARKSIAELATLADGDRKKSEEASSKAAQIQVDITAVAVEAEQISKKLDAAYAAATSQGLASAFSKRSTTLELSMWIWVGGLVAALLAGYFFGGQRLEQLLSVLSAREATTSSVVGNLVLAFVSVAAPVWFAWLATKQIGQRFRLAEDYAFKASVSRAYEGYRREAARVDPELEQRLLASALTRLDEQPLRLVEPSSFGSPLHELLASDTLKEAVKLIPGIKDDLLRVAQQRVREARLQLPGAKPIKGGGAEDAA